MKWQNLCRHRNQDGLGIINIRSLCSTLKCKLLWQLLDSSNNHLKWPTLIKSRYLYHNGFGTLLNVTSGNSSPLWQELKAQFPVINPFMRFQVKNGNNILFSHEHWGINTPLKYYLGDLYSLAKNKKCSLQKILWIYLVKRQVYLDTYMFHSSQVLVLVMEDFMIFLTKLI